MPSEASETEILQQIGYDYGYFVSLNFTKEQFDSLQRSLATWPGSSVEEALVGLCERGQLKIASGVTT